MFGHRARHNEPWTPEADTELARRIADGALLPEIAKAMERSQEAIRSRANVLKLPVKSTNRGRDRAAPPVPPQAGSAQESSSPG